MLTRIKTEEKYSNQTVRQDTSLMTTAPAFDTARCVWTNRKTKRRYDKSWRMRPAKRMWFPT